ncbi:MAG TPA: DMT family transporter [Ramlibacter sp.]|uniref:DMT family transporter n=1 Tax=Ramlibacter sp. TaxID=1917967 RepID=UPI002B763948|nr:DMT family transporter [Ramlibacter sp.]HVZ46689.1 DMT family transporter [Ramlibacter sp.]
MTQPAAVLAASWAWIPIVVWAALAQTARNAAQRSLIARAGTLGATLARFLYGIPFALAWVAVLHLASPAPGDLPPFRLAYFAWLALGAVAQLVATAAMLLAMKQRNFVVGVAFSKTDVLLVALFGTLLLREVPGWLAVLAIAMATAGVVMLSLPRTHVASAGAEGGWLAASWGLASGAGFALSAVGYRGAALEWAGASPGASPWFVSGWGVLLGQSLQTLLLGGWLAWKSPQSLRATATAWRVSIAAGAMGALASVGWFAGFALTSAVNVRAIGMVEVVFSYLVSRRLMREHLAPTERLGLALVMAGLAALVIQA